MQAIDVQIRYDDIGRLHHLAFRLPTGWRAVALSVLRRLPRSNRESPSLIERTRKALKAAYGAGVDLVVLYAGIPGRGVAQLYGAVAADPDRDRAVERARQGLGAVLAMLAAAFPQSRFEPPDIALVEFIRRAFEDNPVGLAFVGQPDPRDGLRAPMPDGAAAHAAHAAGPAAGLQQNEYVFRGMLSLGKPFLVQFLFSRVGNGDPADLFRLMERVRAEASLWRSRVSSTRGWNIGLALPVFLSGLDALGAGSAYGASRTEGAAEGQARTVSEAETRGTADTTTWAKAVTRGEAWTHAVTKGTAVTEGTAATTGTATTTGTAVTEGRFESWGEATATTTGTAVAVGTSSGWSVGGEISVGGPLPVGGSLSGSHTWGTTHTATTTTATTTTTSHSWGTSFAATRSEAVTASSAETTSRAVTTSEAVTHAHTRSEAVTEMTGGARTVSHAVTKGTADTTSTATSRAVGVVQGQALQAARAVGLGLGVAPSVGWSRSYQAVDYVAEMAARALEDQMRLLDQAAVEGAFFVDAYAFLPDAEAREAMKGLFVQAFHGEEGVATPVQPVDLSPDEEARLRRFGLLFMPAPDPEPSPFALEGHRFSTLVTLSQAAAYAAPGAYEEGEADTVSEEIPPFAFPRFEEGILLGHLFSTERGELTDAPVRLARARMASFAAVADTRFGKSVALERLVLEAVREWRFRAVVLDFGLGWRKLLRLLEPDRAELYGLSPQSPRPLRWNPLQIGRRVLPEAQLEVTCEILASAGRMGPRQLGFLRQTLRELYVEHGVLVDDPEVRAHPRWGRVAPEEARVLGLPGNARLEDLSPADRQRLAVRRSQAVDIAMWAERLRALQARFSPRDPSHAALEGVLLRLSPFATGALARMYGRGEGSIPIEDLALPWGLAVLEGGLLQGMEYVKAVLLGLLAWHLYTDAVVRKQTREPGADVPLILLFEEGNKILTAGAAVAGAVEDGSRPQTAEIFQAMFRDAGKYNIFLGVVAQSPSELPPGILSSCNILFVGQLKNPEDVRVALAALGRSPQGFVDTPYMRFIESMPQAVFIGKFGLGRRREDTEPFLFRPLMVEADMPSDEELRTFTPTGGARWPSETSSSPPASPSSPSS
ncbi:MAG: serine-rich protein [Armatimonadota bacterium]|nr:serine-rich protein [Armatimonadota bacterium]